MNYSQNSGWYYINSINRSPSWSGVDFFGNFLLTNNYLGPFAIEVEMTDIVPGDFIQLSFSGNKNFDHSLVVVEVLSPITPQNILIATHTIDRDYYPLSNYRWVDIKLLHILGSYR